MRTLPIRINISGILIAAIATLLPFGHAAAADNSTIPEATIEQLVRDLAELQQAVLKGEEMLRSGASPLQLSESPATEDIIVADANVPIRGGAAGTAPALTTAKAGEAFQVLDQAGEWYAVPLPEEINGVTMGWMSASNVTPLSLLTDPLASLMRKALQRPIETAVKIKNSYANNPYISVSGFSVSLGTNSSVSMSFGFK